VSLTAPSSGATAVAPATWTVSANASDSDGIGQVAFYAGTTLIGTDTTAPYSVTWSSVPAGTYSLTAVATDALGASTTSAPVTVTVTSPSGSPATFVKTDTTTRGNWIGVYGSNGYSIAAGTPSLPAGTSVSSGGNTYTWVSPTTAIDALQTPSGSRAATTWFGSTFTIDVNVGSATRKVGLYLVDWDLRYGSDPRSETIEVHDATTGALLDTRYVTGFGSGQYWVWTVTGHVTFKVIWTGGINAVVSGVFID
jgi:hypothetical protein